MARLPFLFCLVAALGLLAAADGIYSSKSPVLQVNTKNYDSLIAQSNQTSIVEFYAPWCGHCQNLKPAYEKAAKNLAGLAKVAAVNCDEESNKPLCGQFGVQGFPTLKIIRPGKKAGKPMVEDYQGPREAKAIVEAVSDKITNHVKRLKADTLDAWVEGGTRPKAILFTEKGTTAPLVKALAIDFLGSIDFAQVRNKETAAVDKYEIEKFPTIVLLQGDNVSKYDGEISKEALTTFLSQAASPNQDPAPKEAKAKSTSTKKSKSASSSASSAFSKASEDHKSSDFEEYLEHASTVVVEDGAPSDSPLPIVENKQKPMVVPDVTPPLPTLEASSDLRARCLQADSSHCVLVLLPSKAGGEADYADGAAEALSGFAAVEEKYNKRKANIFPAYAVPSDNDDAGIIRQALGLKSETEVDVVVVNIKKGWAKKYSKSSFDAKSIESFMDDIRFGEGTKQKLPADFFAEPGSTAEPTASQEPEASSSETAAESSSTHDEL
ncbi:hypothetical protein OHC33_010857 [Knufia fluminis]|uniref:protein disulfide-isomerase n=1 Tax=Knufia fluminis TaxID=191047 RepID=A0AAN8I279_9EURO|nr:hypothetical protein OHC33_010857 [Knufia fluminis]